MMNVNLYECFMIGYKLVYWITLSLAGFIVPNYSGSNPGGRGRDRGRVGSVNIRLKMRNKLVITIFFSFENNDDDIRIVLGGIESDEWITIVWRMRGGERGRLVWRRRGGKGRGGQYIVFIVTTMLMWLRDMSIYIKILCCSR